MELLTSLVFKCYKNDLAIEITPHISGLVEIKDWGELSKDGKTRNFTDVSEGYTQNWEHETPEETLTRMHQEVDEYINNLYMEEDVSFDETEDKPRLISYGLYMEEYVSFDEDEAEQDKSRLTSYERKHREAGVKESDFL